MIVYSTCHVWFRAKRKMWGGAGATRPLSLLLPIAHPLGTNFFPSPTFRCCKKSKMLDIILTKEILSTHSPGTSLQATVTKDLIQTIETYSAYKKYKKKNPHFFSSGSSHYFNGPYFMKMVHNFWKPEATSTSTCYLFLIDVDTWEIFSLQTLIQKTKYFRTFLRTLTQHN